MESASFNTGIMILILLSGFILLISDYSVIANPFTLEYQSCTEHTLDVITAAIYETNDIKVIKIFVQNFYKNSARL